nr:DEAD/DEAH box helicase family protein [Deltaproteobacteria bacterium]
MTDRLKTAPCVPSLRVAVKMWREGGYKGTTDTTRKLLRYWFIAEHRTVMGGLFRYHNAQREAVETLIFVWEYEKVLTRKGLLERYATDLTGVPLPEGGDWPRYALKMATGSGKTKVMAMVMAWQLLNAAAEPPHIAKHYARTVLLIAPGLIVFERPRTDFGAGRIFHIDPVIPKELEIYWDLGVVERGDGVRTDSESMLYFTNVDQLYEGRDAPNAEPDAMTAVLGPKAPLKKLDPTDFEERIALRDGPVMVLNDEAHAWPGSKWDEVIGRVAKRSTLALQVDLSATPRFPKTGTLFPWTVFDYPLKQAILDGIVKRPVRGIAKIAEVGRRTPRSGTPAS